MDGVCGHINHMQVFAKHSLSHVLPPKDLCSAGSLVVFGACVCDWKSPYFKGKNVFHFSTKAF